MRSKAVLLCLYTFAVLCFSGCISQEEPQVDLPSEIKDVVEADMMDDYPAAENVLFQDYQALDDILIVALTFHHKEYEDDLYPNRFCFYVLVRQENGVDIIYKTDNGYPVDKDKYPMYAGGFELAISEYPLVLSVDSFCINTPNIQTLHLYGWDGSLRKLSVVENQRLLFYAQWNNGEHLEHIDAFDEDGTSIMTHSNLQPVIDFEIPMVDLSTEE